MGLGVGAGLGMALPGMLRDFAARGPSGARAGRGLRPLPGAAAARRALLPAVRSAAGRLIAAPPRGWTGESLAA